MAVVRRRLNGYEIGVEGGGASEPSGLVSDGMETPRASAISDNNVLVASLKSGSRRKVD